MADGSPRLFVDAPTHDFGVARQQQRLAHSFRIENRGRTDLVIEEVRSPCDCDAEDITGRPISAGDAIPFKVVLETRGYEGPQRRVIELRTNDPLRPTVALEVRARVCTGFAIQPRSLMLTDRAEGYSSEGRLRIFNCDDGHLGLSGVDASVSWLATSWEHVAEENGGGYIVRVRVDQEAPVGWHAEVVSLQLEQSGRSMVDVPVIVQVRDRRNAAVPPPASHQ